MSFLLLLFTDQHRHRGVVDDVIAHTAHDRPPEFAEASSSGDDKQGIPGDCALDDRRSGLFPVQSSEVAFCLHDNRNTFKLQVYIKIEHNLKIHVYMK